VIERKHKHQGDDMFNYVAIYKRSYDARIFKFKAENREQAYTIAENEKRLDESLKFIQTKEMFEQCFGGEK
jgi:hypothetical protein